VLRLFYCDHYTMPLPAGHKVPTAKYRLLREELEAGGLFQLEPAPAADPETIMLAHNRAYVQHFLQGTLPTLVMRRIGFPWSQELARRTLASVGGTLAAAEDAMHWGFGGNLAGGTHHAFRTQGAGFCVFNDIAVAILALRRKDRVSRAAVIDLDVHQGDGTAAIFADDPSVFTLSVHGRNNFPFRKQQSRVDIDLADGAGDQEFLSAVTSVLPRAFAFEPQVVFYQSGVDGLAGDRLGRLALTHVGLRARDRLVLEACHSRRIPVVVTLGGGYAEPVSLTVEAHANTFRTAAEVFGTL
jgi:acetoin utilization deacetylase AcuC-like enzyme